LNSNSTKPKIVRTGCLFGFLNQGLGLNSRFGHKVATESDFGTILSKKKTGPTGGIPPSYTKKQNSMN